LYFWPKYTSNWSHTRFIKQIWAIDMRLNAQNKTDTTGFRVIEYQLDKNKKTDLEYLTDFFGTFFVGDTCNCFPSTNNFYCIESLSDGNKVYPLNDTISSTVSRLIRHIYLENYDTFK
jgi:hypothetical protein